MRTYAVGQRVRAAVAGAVRTFTVAAVGRTGRRNGVRLTLVSLDGRWVTVAPASRVKGVLG